MGKLLRESAYVTLYGAFFIFGWGLMDTHVFNNPIAGAAECGHGIGALIGAAVFYGLSFVADAMARVRGAA